MQLYVTLFTTSVASKTTVVHQICLSLSLFFAKVIIYTAQGQICFQIGKNKQTTKLKNKKQTQDMVISLLPNLFQLGMWLPGHFTRNETQRERGRAQRRKTLKLRVST